MRVDMQWSVAEPGCQCILRMPDKITLVELDDFEQAVAIQLRGVRRALEKEATTPDAFCAHGLNTAYPCPDCLGTALPSASGENDGA